MGAGIAFVLMPLSMTVFAFISRKDMGAASVLNSYLSVIGGSISIFLVTNLLMQRMDVNFVYLASAINSDNPAISQVVRSNGIDVAMHATYAQVMRQSAMFAFNDVWYLMAYISILLVLYLPFMKRAGTELK